MPTYGREALLSGQDWVSLSKILKSEKTSQVLQILKDQANKPCRAGILFSPDRANQNGTDNINNLLRLGKVPFRLVRIGSYERGLPRSEYKLAFVRHDSLAQKKKSVPALIMPLDHEDSGRPGD